MPHQIQFSPGHPLTKGKLYLWLLLLLPRRKKQPRSYSFRLEYVTLLNIMPFFTLTILSLRDFRPEYNNQWLPQILPILHQLVRSSPSHPLFISSLSAFTPYWPVAEETLIDQAVGSSSPPQSPVPASPRIQPASPQPEVSALPNHPSSTQLATKEPSTEPERSPSLI
jgi:hypothetical protein